MPLLTSVPPMTILTVATVALRSLNREPFPVPRQALLPLKAAAVAAAKEGVVSLRTESASDPRATRPQRAAAEGKKPARAVKDPRLKIIAHQPLPQRREGSRSILVVGGAVIIVSRCQFCTEVPLK